MSRKVFFSFHYANDNWRANQVRNSWVTKPDRASAGFTDKAEFEKIKAKGKQAVQNWIDDQLYGTSVTVVLIGSETNTRDYVKYELSESNKRGNGIIGIYIHSLKDHDGKTSHKGSDTFGQIFFRKNGEACYFFELYDKYDWKEDDGYNNLGAWIEKAAKNAGK